MYYASGNYEVKGWLGGGDKLRTAASCQLRIKNPQRYGHLGQVRTMD